MAEQRWGIDVGPESEEMADGIRMMGLAYRGLLASKDPERKGDSVRLGVMLSMVAFHSGL